MNWGGQAQARPARDTIVGFDDVELTSDLDVVALRKQMEDATRSSPARSAA
jgi:predicted homoserine dehydrogenase-like protein